MTMLNKDIEVVYAVPEIVVAECAQCAGEIYKGDSAYLIELNDDLIHDQCLEPYCQDALGAQFVFAGEEK